MLDANTNDPLRRLLVDAAEVDRQAIAEVLEGRVSIDAGSGRLVLMPGYAPLDARRKILLVLLSRKAACLLGVADSEALTNGQLIEQTGVAPGTVAPGLKSLRELRLVGQEANRAYYVPNAQLAAAIRFLTRQRQ